MRWLSEVVTYLRVNINGKWTNLGIVADENEINEHFEFVQDLLNQKQRADELQILLDKLKVKLDEIWKLGDSEEHEFAFRIIKLINELEGDEKCILKNKKKN